MNTVRRTLTPIRLAIPTILALSAFAAWTPTESAVGTGFYTDTDTSSTALIEAGYNRPSHNLDGHVYLAWRASSNGDWFDLGPPVDVHTDFWRARDPGVTKPPWDWAIAQAWGDDDSGNHYAYAAVSDF